MPMHRGPEKVGYGALASKHAEEAAADVQSSAYSGLAFGGAKGPRYKGRPDTDARGMASDYTQGGGLQGAGYTYQRSSSGRFSVPGTGGAGRGLHEYYSEDTSMRRVTGDDYGPMQLLKEFQGSNRGSGGYVAAIPRYSIAETRKVGGKFDKKNFLQLNKHPGKKFLQPGTEQMMQRRKNDFGGARRVMRQFL
jgi:hypothetical protein